MIRIWPRRRWLQVLVATVVIVLVPYLLSRIASPWRCVQVVSEGASAKRPTANGSLRVVSYNIAHGRGLAKSNWNGGSRSERSSRLTAIADLLVELDADVVVLNEVDFDASWSGHANQAEFLARRAKFPYRVEQRNLDFRVLGWTWRFGNAVLSKYPITEAEVLDLPGYAAWETIFVGKKRAFSCTVNYGDQPVRIIGAHLSHRSESLRVHSARFIRDFLDGSDTPTIIAGDLNSTPPDFPNSILDANEQNAIEVFDEQALFRRMPSLSPPPDESLTFPADRPNQVIDWILIPRQWRFASYDVSPSRLSDHRPVVATIDLAAENTANRTENQE